MAHAYKCDICGKYFSVEPEEEFGGGYPRYSVHISARSGIGELYQDFCGEDVCPECYKYIRDYIRSKGVVTWANLS